MRKKRTHRPTSYRQPRVQGPSSGWANCGSSVYSRARTANLAWPHIVPSLANAQLVNLNTLVVDCHNRKALGKLFSAAAPALRSLAIRFICPGESFQLPLSLLGQIS